jgi:hypothetical protein
VRQYDLDARLIYERLASGQLAWIGLADRGAGEFDDLVLGLTVGSIEAYQLKTSKHPEPFSIETLLTGAQNLLRRKIEARDALGPEARGGEIRTIFACDDFPRVDDNIGPPGRAGSSAGFLTTFAQYRETWSLEEWKASPFGAFIGRLQAASKLGDEAFTRLFRGMRFLPAGAEPRQGHQAQTAGDHRRIRELAAHLPRLVADARGRDRWTAEELLAAMGWRDAFGVRHAHQFPVDEFVQRNPETEEALQAALASRDQGYVSLLGPPGAGKSTLLQSGLLPMRNVIIVRYLAFVPGEGQGLGRAEAYDFLHDLVTQLKQGGLGQLVIPSADLQELRPQFARLLTEAGERFISDRHADGGRGRRARPRPTGRAP